MQNYVAPGKVISGTAPYAVSSGDGCLIGATFGVAQADALISTNVELATEGVFTLAKATGAAWTAWTTLIYWDDTAKKCTAAPTGNTLIGVAAAAAGSSATTGDVRLQLTLAA